MTSHKEEEGVGHFVTQASVEARVRISYHLVWYFVTLSVILLRALEYQTILSGIQMLYPFEYQRLIDWILNPDFWHPLFRLYINEGSNFKTLPSHLPCQI